MKKIWIINHNAMPPSLGGLNRHHYFSKYLAQEGYFVRIITASNVHNSGVNIISGKEPYCEKECDGIVYTFVRTAEFTGHGLSRIKNIMEFLLRLWGICKAFGMTEGYPDVIYTSSPDIFACFQAIRISKKLKTPCIFEVRDLWPESIVAYGLKSKRNLIIKAMYKMEKWMYTQADKLIFTSEGGKDYIVECGWDKTIKQDKIYHIGNGLDLSEFDYNLKTFSIDERALDDENSFKGVYVGSMRHVNNIEVLVEAAEILQDRKRDFILILFGDGGSTERVQAMIEEKRISNVILRQRVEKKFVPYILSKADFCILHFRQSSLLRYGHSSNKLCDYLAAGKPVLSDLVVSHDIIKQHDCGIAISSQTPEAIANGIEKMMDMPETEHTAFGQNARKAAVMYDYKALTHKLIEIIEDLIA